MPGASLLWVALTMAVGGLFAAQSAINAQLAQAIGSSIVASAISFWAGAALLLGVSVAIDDFGTGYSSLVYLKALPLDYVKIDKALARDIAGDPRDRVVIRGVIEIACALGLAVIAEGVETPQQLALLTAEGCGWYQGFLRAGGLDEAALVAMVEGER